MSSAEIQVDQLQEEVDCATQDQMLQQEQCQLLEEGDCTSSADGGRSDHTSPSQYEVFQQQQQQSSGSEKEKCHSTNIKGQSHTNVPPPRLKHADPVVCMFAKAKTPEEKRKCGAVVWETQERLMEREVQARRIQRQTAGLTEEESLPDPVETLRALQAEPLDTKVQVVLDSLPRRTVVGIVRLLCNSPDTVYALCEKERGKIVTQVIATLRGEGCECLVDCLSSNIHQTATHRVGCVALTRTFDALMTYKRPMGLCASSSAGGRQRCRLDDASATRNHKIVEIEVAPTRSVLHFINRVLSVLPDLAFHPQGNFVCSTILGPGAPREAFEALLTCFANSPEFLVQLAGSKSGSHVIDAYANNCDYDGMLGLIAFLQQHPTLITEMGNSNVANYSLQTILQNAVKVLTTPGVGRAEPEQHPRLLWLVENVPILTVSSYHFVRITGSLGIRVAGKVRSVQQHQSNRPQQQRGQGQQQLQAQAQTQDPQQQHAAYCYLWPPRPQQSQPQQHPPQMYTQLPAHQVFSHQQHHHQQQQQQQMPHQQPVQQHQPYPGGYVVHPYMPNN